MKTNPVRILVFAIICTLILTGCAQALSRTPSSHLWATIQGGQLDEVASGDQFYFMVPVDQALIDSGLPIHVEVSGRVETGALTYQLRRPDGTVLWSSGKLTGEYSINEDIRPDRATKGDYSLGMVYDAGTRATYNLGWHALTLKPTILIPGIGMTLVALLAAAWALRKGGTWRMLGWGALFWAFTVALKFAWAIPVNTPLSQLLGVSYQNPLSAGNIVFYIYVGALTGIFEVLVAWLALRKRALGRASWKQALAFGVGFGAFEALLLGLLALVQSIGVLLTPDTLPIATLGGMANNNDMLFAIAPVVERISVIFAHVFTCVAIFYAIAVRQPKWMWMAVLYKTVLDTPAGLAQFTGLSTLDRLWAIEGAILVMGLVGLWAAWRISLRYPTPGEQVTMPPQKIEQAVVV